MPRPDTAPPPLDADDQRRYARHLLLPEVGAAGQRRLKGARVLLVGVGGLGSPAALYLAAAGIGHLTVVDPDVVDASNLQRQVLHGTAAVGRPKVESARDRLADLNPGVRVDGRAVRLDRGNALELVASHDVVVDGTDSFPARYLVNDACVAAGRPNVHGSVFRFDGQASVFAAPGGPCYRCLHPAPPPPGTVPACGEAGVLGVLPGLIGLVQATEVVKLVLGIGEPLVGRLLVVDALGMRFRELRIPRDPACPACGAGAARGLLAEVAEVAAPPGPGPGPAAIAEIDARTLAARLARGEPIELVDVRELHEWNAGRLAGARHAPLSAFGAFVGSFDPSREVVVYCRSGVRSLDAAGQLLAAGVLRVSSLAGGLRRWAAEIDPGIRVG